MQIGDFLNKTVLSLTSAENLGKVTAVCFENSLEAVCSIQTEKGFVPFNRILFVRDAVFVDGGVLADGEQENCVYPVGLSVFSSKGACLGSVIEIKFDSNGKVQRVICDAFSFSPTKIAQCKDFILCGAKQTKKTVSSQTRINTDFNFLLGRVCDKKIINFYGETIVKENSVVTKEILLSARRNNKLVELSLHSK